MGLWGNRETKITREETYQRAHLRKRTRTCRAALWPRGFPRRSHRGAECLTDEGEKRLVVERLQEKGKRAPFQRSGAKRGCIPAGHHDHFRVGRHLAELRLHFQAARLWHPHIEHGQAHRMAAGVREEILCAFSPSESSSCSIERRTEASSSRMHMESGCAGMGTAPVRIQVPVKAYDT